MEHTYLDYFNYYLKEFCNEIINNFPEYKKTLLENYRNLLEGRDDKNALYVKYFLNNVNDYIDDICSKNTKLFDNEYLYFLIGVNFTDIWHSDMNNEMTSIAIWKYLQLLCLLSRYIIPEHEEITDILGKIGGKVEPPAKMLRTFAYEEDINNDDDDDHTNSFDMLNAVNMVINLFNNKGKTIGNIKSLLKGVLKGLGFDNIDNLLEKYNLDKIINEIGMQDKELNNETIQEILNKPEKIYNIFDILTENLDEEGTNDAIGEMLLMIKKMINSFKNMNFNKSNNNDNDDNDENNNIPDLNNIMKNIFNNDIFKNMNNDDGNVNPMNIFNSLFGNNSQNSNNNSTDDVITDDNIINENNIEVDTNNNNGDNNDDVNDNDDNNDDSNDMSNEMPNINNMINNILNNDTIKNMTNNMSDGNEMNPMDMISSLMGNNGIQNMAKKMAQKNPNILKEAKNKNKNNTTRDRLRAKLEAKKNNK